MCFLHLLFNFYNTYFIFYESNQVYLCQSICLLRVLSSDKIIVIFIMIYIFASKCNISIKFEELRLLKHYLVSVVHYQRSFEGSQPYYTQGENGLSDPKAEGNITFQKSLNIDLEFEKNIYLRITEYSATALRQIKLYLVCIICKYNVSNQTEECVYYCKYLEQHV